MSFCCFSLEASDQNTELQCSSEWPVANHYDHSSPQWPSCCITVPWTCVCFNLWLVLVLSQLFWKAKLEPRPHPLKDNSFQLSFSVLLEECLSPPMTKWVSSGGDGRTGEGKLGLSRSISRCASPRLSCNAVFCSCPRFRDSARLAWPPLPWSSWKKPTRAPATARQPVYLMSRLTFFFLSKRLNQEGKRHVWREGNVLAMTSFTGGSRAGRARVYFYHRTCAPPLTGGFNWWLEVQDDAVMRSQGSDFPPAPNLNKQLRGCTALESLSH